MTVPPTIRGFVQRRRNLRDCALRVIAADETRQAAERQYERALKDLTAAVASSYENENKRKGGKK